MTNDIYDWKTYISFFYLNLGTKTVSRSSKAIMTHYFANATFFLSAFVNITEEKEKFGGVQLLVMQ